MTSESRRLALIVASSHYTDKTLQQLLAPGQDAAALARVLADPAIGQFETKQLIDRPSYEVRREIESFFANRKRDDLVLVYFSGHGIKSDDGRLYLATIDTERGLPLATTVPATFLHDTMSACQSRRQVLILDCCHSGAFAAGMVTKGGGSVDIRERFEGQGRVVLTASNSIQYAFEGDKVIGDGARSVFTRHLVRGLETGEADLDGDGLIVLAELYDYVYAHQVDETPNQRPGMWAFKVEGDLIVAHSPRGKPSAEDEDAQIAPRYRRALAALSAGRWQEAHACLEKLVAEHPHYKDAAERVGPLRHLAAQMAGLGPAPRGWRFWVAAFPILACLVAGLTPNAFGAVFNYAYNWLTIVVGDTHRELVFFSTAVLVNGLGFGLGVALYIWMAWPVVRALRQLRQGEPVPLASLVGLRRLTLNLGHLAACFGVSLWILAGPVYPVSIHFWDSSMTPRDYAYFMVSLCLGGLIAAVYPFFSVTFLSVRVFYPPLMLPGSTVAEDREWLKRLHRLTWRYLLLAVSVPMFAIVLGLLVQLGPDKSAADETALLAVLGICGLAGCGVVFWLCRAIQRDVAVLKHAASRSRPGRDEGLVTSEIDSG
jgi:Caspase domain